MPRKQKLTDAQRAKRYRRREVRDPHMREFEQAMAREAPQCFFASLGTCTPPVTVVQVPPFSATRITTVNLCAAHQPQKNWAGKIGRSC